jgi:hypothetical protein
MLSAERCPLSAVGYQLIAMTTSPGMHYHFDANLHGLEIMLNLMVVVGFLPWSGLKAQDGMISEG